MTTKMLALTFYPTSNDVRVALGRQARYARQDPDGSIVTRRFDWTWKDRCDPIWDDVPVLEPDDFDAKFGPRR